MKGIALKKPFGGKGLSIAVDDDDDDNTNSASTEGDKKESASGESGSTGSKGAVDKPLDGYDEDDDIEPSWSNNH